MVIRPDLAPSESSRIALYRPYSRAPLAARRNALHPSHLLLPVKSYRDYGSATIGYGAIVRMKISNRLGWLDAPEESRERLAEIEQWLAELREDGIQDMRVLGMGGSSLAPELFERVFGSADRRSDLNPGANGTRDESPRVSMVVDSTDPALIDARLAAASMDPQKMHVIVATKSGGTVETLSAFKLAYSRILDNANGDIAQAGRAFTAITDAGSALHRMAEELAFRHIFLNPADIGGRFSALTLFGLVPAAWLGIDLNRLLDRAEASMKLTQTDQAAIHIVDSPDPSSSNRSSNLEDPTSPAVHLAAFMGICASVGRDKLSLVLPNEIGALGDWIEQLVAESTGKDGKGILPVLGESSVPPEFFGTDRAFVVFSLGSDQNSSESSEADIREQALDVLAKAGHPVCHIHLADRYDIGAQFFDWEVATALVSHLLVLHPFDQPDVEAAKVAARGVVDAFLTQGELPEESQPPVSAEAGQLGEFLSEVRAGDYIALQAFLNPSDACDGLLSKLQSILSQRYKVATTVGYGPRFLHSTGQLHKGDAGRGHFVQLRYDVSDDPRIPDAPGSGTAAMSFGTLMLAQAMGDAAALRAAGRPVLCMDLGEDPLEALRALL